MCLDSLELHTWQHYAAEVLRQNSYYGVKFVQNYKMPLNRFPWGRPITEADYKIPCPCEDRPTDSDYICSPLDAALGYSDVKASLISMMASILQDSLCCML